MFRRKNHETQIKCTLHTHVNGPMTIARCTCFAIGISHKSWNSFGQIMSKTSIQLPSSYCQLFVWLHPSINTNYQHLVLSQAASEATSYGPAPSHSSFHNANWVSFMQSHSLIPSLTLMPEKLKPLFSPSNSTPIEWLYGTPDLTNIQYDLHTRVHNN